MKSLHRPLGALTVLCAFLFLAQVLGAQQPNGTRNPTTAENNAVDAAEQAAQDIVNQLTGDAKKKAEENLRAWRDARKAGRFRIGVPIENKEAPRGFTWPDTPYDGTKPPAKAAETGSYKPGQTDIQITSLAAWFVARACPCAVAVVILHEGHRLNQDVPAHDPADSPSIMMSKAALNVANEQELSKNDLNNIQAARAACQGTDDACKKELDELEKGARAFLNRANNAAVVSTARGYPVPVVQPPYPPTY